MTGTTTAPSNGNPSNPYWELDTYDPPGNVGYFQGSPGGGDFDAYFAQLDMLTYHLDYCTYWGGSGDDRGIALETTSTPSANTSTDVFIGGLTYSTNLDQNHLPAGTGVYHNSVAGGDADGFLLQYSTSPNIGLVYGTLLGGAGADAVLDIERNQQCGLPEAACMLYLTGETGSSSAILIADDDPLLYHQTILGNLPGNSSRDAFLIALVPQSMLPRWSTYYGGQYGDKGWGLAATASSLYLVGGADSDQLTFPLKEFSTSSPLDWYDVDFLNNSEGMNWGFYAFNDAAYNYFFSYFYSPFGDDWTGFSPDGFIASFDLTPSVGVQEKPTSGNRVRIDQIDPDGVWNVHLPIGGPWTAKVYNSTGSWIKLDLRTTDQELKIDLRDRASGMYVVQLKDVHGNMLGAKLLK